MKRNSHLSLIQSNKEQNIRRYYQAVDAHDLDTIYSLFSDDIVYERAGSPVIAGIIEFKKFYESERQILIGQHTLLDVIADDHGVAVRGIFNGQLKNGRNVSTKFSDIFIMSGDKVQQRYTFFDGTEV
ncbi:nuclear transport factor 2 family protein [Sulfoacidibacillus ferrooxidans]|uniref:SnoaL-like domain-containing protein n=1 Tax=Sulfoacidibacillus ferrooxidans TaxID=2005001 RepID=A0A9X1V9Y4_9BACL|nr:nuclear transport factor 2 family protein [Sulfoacidibacillus ferrooxidans]MCI0183930.1 hypothetical protein [Sulfoacidibacillus ferrooxidans]